MLMNDTRPVGVVVDGLRLRLADAPRSWLRLIVKVSGAGTAWVGLTLYPGREINLDPVRIWPEQAGITITRFSGVELSAHLADPVLYGGFNYAATLWRERISLGTCRRRYGEDSELCARAEQNGFQMEGRLDQWEGRYP